MDDESKSAKILIVFLVAIFAFGISNCVALWNNEFINLDFLNSLDYSNSSNIFEINETSKNDSPQIYYNDSNKNNESNNDKDNKNNNKDKDKNDNDEPFLEPKPPQNNTPETEPSN